MGKRVRGRHRHRRLGSPAEGIVAEACRDHGLPAPRVTVHEARARRGIGLEAHVELRFGVAVRGPLLLGRTRFVGGGLFAAT